MKSTKHPKLTIKQKTELRDAIVAFLVKETWPSVVDDFLGNLQPQGWHYCRWYPTPLSAMLEGDFGEVRKDVQGSPYYPSSEYYREGNFPVTIWDNGGRHYEPDLSWCELDEVPRDQAEYLVGNGNPDEENLYVKGEDITDEELELKARGWEYVVRTGPDDPEPLESALRDKLNQIVEERLDLLLTPAEAPI